MTATIDCDLFAAAPGTTLSKNGLREGNYDLLGPLAATFFGRSNGRQNQVCCRFFGENGFNLSDGTKICFILRAFCGFRVEVSFRLCGAFR